MVVVVVVVVATQRNQPCSVSTRFTPKALMGAYGTLVQANARHSSTGVASATGPVSSRLSAVLQRSFLPILAAIRLSITMPRRHRTLRLDQERVSLELLRGELRILKVFPDTLYFYSSIPRPPKLECSVNLLCEVWLLTDC